MTHEMFDQQYTSDQKRAIYIAHPDAFDELALNGYISTRYLPS